MTNEVGVSPGQVVSRGQIRVFFPPTHERTNEWWYGFKEAASQELKTRGNYGRNRGYSVYKITMGGYIYGMIGLDSERECWKLH